MFFCVLCPSRKHSGTSISGGGGGSGGGERKKEEEMPESTLESIASPPSPRASGEWRRDSPFEKAKKRRKRKGGQSAFSEKSCEGPFALCTNLISSTIKGCAIGINQFNKTSFSYCKRSLQYVFLPFWEGGASSSLSFFEGGGGGKGREENNLLLGYGIKRKAFHPI